MPLPKTAPSPDPTGRDPYRQFRYRRTEPLLGADGKRRVVCDDDGNAIPRTLAPPLHTAHDQVFRDHELLLEERRERKRQYNRDRARALRIEALGKRRLADAEYAPFSPEDKRRTEASNAQAPGMPYYELGNFHDLHHLIQHVRKPAWHPRPHQEDRRVRALHDLYDVLTHVSEQTRATIVQAINDDPYVADPDSPTFVPALLDQAPIRGISTKTPLNDRAVMAAYFAYKFSTYDLQYTYRERHDKRHRDDVPHARPKMRFFTFAAFEPSKRWVSQRIGTHKGFKVQTKQPLRDVFFGYHPDQGTQPAQPQDGGLSPFNPLAPLGGEKRTWSLNLKNLYRIAEFFDFYGMFDGVEDSLQGTDDVHLDARDRFYHAMPPFVYMVMEMALLWDDLHELVTTHPHVFFHKSPLLMRSRREEAKPGLAPVQPGLWGMKAATVRTLENRLTQRMYEQRYLLNAAAIDNPTYPHNYAPMWPELVGKNWSGGTAHPLRNTMQDRQFQTARSLDVLDYCPDSVTCMIQEHFTHAQHFVAAMNRSGARMDPQRARRIIDYTEQFVGNPELRKEGKDAPRISWDDWVHMAYVFQISPAAWLLHITYQLYWHLEK